MLTYLLKNTQQLQQTITSLQIHVKYCVRICLEILILNLTSLHFIPFRQMYARQVLLQ